MPAVLYTLAFLFGVLAVKATAKPNIIVIFMDDTGWGDIGANWQDTRETPNIDRLAAEGLRFTDFHAGASVCTPSRAALLTGRLGKRTGVTTNFGTTSIGGLPTNETILPEMLKPAGYRSYMIGKWHLGHNAPFHPSYRGFETYLGLPFSNDMGCTDVPGKDLPPLSRCPRDPSDEASLREQITMSTDSWTLPSDTWEYNEHDAIQRAQKTYNVAVPLYDCKSPNCGGNMATCNGEIAEQPVNLTTLADRYAGRAEEIIHMSANGTSPFLLYMAFAHMHVPLAHELQFNNASARKTTFGDTLVEADATVGRVMAALKKTGLDDNTLIFFTSDNGPWNVKCDLCGSQGPFNGTWQKEHGTGGATGKFTTWEGGHRVAGIARWPGKIRSGAVTHAMASTLDFMPTFAALAGVELPTDRSFDGVDLSDVLFKGSHTAHDTLFHPDGSGDLSAMRLGKYKAFYQTYGSPACGGGKGQTKVHEIPLVFDLEADQAESKPIDASKELIKKLNDARNEKLNDIAHTLHSKANYAAGGPDKRPCCDAAHVVCRCHH
eukprot:NODE_1233_length_1822_cov_67.510889_g1170_i0.p1 GENE.NODE_1233_length_1822_cov_67.510889_g1170_i0~~NODE_1233_length_1822_cov_67.510889_g1170_i0.p1  ORF type:complete len:548 (-),score=108.63 NODE_1233_length_1822_cov_67.510889_g1170_i0:124-1767(-)